MTPEPDGGARWSTPLASAIDRLPTRLTALAGALLAVEAALLGGFLAATDWSVLEPRYLLYPFAWINAGVLAVARVESPAATRRRRLVAGAVAVAYFLALAWISGLVQAGGTGQSFSVVWLPPGWGPVPVYVGPLVSVTAFPFRVIGYAALAYLVFAAVLAVDRSVASGVVGLFSCISCAAPLFGAVGAGMAGLSGGAVSAVSTLSYDLSTAVFLTAVGLLAWLPHRTG